MAHHRLKIWPQHFLAIQNGFKTHEVRVNDRDFKEGDELLLEEWNPETLQYSGNTVLCVITHMTLGGQFGIAEDHVVMSIRMQHWYTPNSTYTEDL